MKCEIVVILDRSGSMNVIRDDIIGGLNSFIRDRKSEDYESSFTLVQFDDKYDIVYDDVDLKEIHEISNDWYVPRGMTALYDAIGKTIKYVSGRNSCDKCSEEKKTIISIITDGFENCSTKYTQEKVNKLVSKFRDDRGWEFIFMAANQDAFATGRKFGISRKDAFSFDANSAGTRGGLCSVSASYSGYMGTNLFEEDDK